MKSTRRFFAVLLLTLTALAFAAKQNPQAAGKTKYLALVGTYTTKTESKGIYAFDFDAATGTLTPKGVAAETPDPSWVVIHPNGKFAYAANEAGKASTVSAFALDAKSGKLSLLNSLPSQGEDPCHLSFDKTGKFLLVANYTSGTVAVFPIQADGKLGEHTAVMKDEGTLGPNKERQEAPHAHWVETSADNHVAYVADLGLDRVFAYRFDSIKGVVSPIRLPQSVPPDAQIHDPLAMPLKPGTGPRHAAFSPNGDFWYILGELTSTVTALTGFSSFQTVSTLPSGFSGRNDAAEIEVHPTGKFLYASNRGDDSIADFSIDPKKGTLTFVARVPTGGKEPRNFAIDPSGKYLLAENQFSNNIVVFKIDPKTGGLMPTGQVVDVPSPVDLTFVAAE
jgi:6-phosphogluconolactonase